MQASVHPLLSFENFAIAVSIQTVYSVTLPTGEQAEGRNLCDTGIDMKSSSSSHWKCWFSVHTNSA